MAKVLAAQGKYERHVVDLITHGYANLTFLRDRVFEAKGSLTASCSVTHFSPEGHLLSTRPVQQSDLDQSNQSSTSPRLFVLEGISSQWVEALGSAFDIEPEFFNSHLLSWTWAFNNGEITPKATTLLSTCETKRYWSVNYLENVKFASHFPQKRYELIQNEALPRYIFVRTASSQDGQSYSLGLVNRMVSFWHHGRDAVLLIDPPLDAKIAFKLEHPDQARTLKSAWTPYGGGFVDFAPLEQRPAFITAASASPQKRSDSLSDSLLWRLKNPLLFVRSPDPLNAAGLLLQKIILSHWMLTVSVLHYDNSATNVNIKELFNDQAPIDQVRQALSDLEAATNLLHWCSTFIRTNIARLKTSYFCCGTSPITNNSMSDLILRDWVGIQEDIDLWIKDTQRRFESGLAKISILDSKRANDDSRRGQQMAIRAQMSAESVGQLTKLGQILLLIYTPVSLAYGVLSMGNSFAPGQDQFWVFFAIAVPLSVLTVAVYALWMNLDRRRGRERIDNVQGWET